MNNLLVFDLSSSKNLFHRGRVDLFMDFHSFVDTCLASADSEDLFGVLTSMSEHNDDPVFNAELDKISLNDLDFYMQMAFEAVFETINPLIDITETPINVLAINEIGHACVKRTNIS